jgi:hypothetical protein
MFWGCIAYYGVGNLVAIDGNMNTDKYISVLDDNLWPVVVRHFSDRPWIFQEDNAPCRSKTLVGLPPNIDFPISTQHNFCLITKYYG